MVSLPNNGNNRHGLSQSGSCTCCMCCTTRKRPICPCPSRAKIVVCYDFFSYCVCKRINITLSDDPVICTVIYYVMNRRRDVGSTSIYCLPYLSKIFSYWSSWVNLHDCTIFVKSIYLIFYIWSSIVIC